MNTCIYKKLSLFILFMFNITLYGKNNHIESYISIGPAWHKFYSVNSFTFSQPLILPDQEIVVTNFALMPYVEGMVRSYMHNHINMQIIVGGGRLSRGQVEILETVPTIVNIANYIRQGTLKADLVTIDVNGGFKCTVLEEKL